MDTWREQLTFDPLPYLLSSENEALIYFVRRDLLEESNDSIELIWQLPEVRKILAKQLSDGSWPRVGEEKHPAINYHLIETWKQFRYLVEQYGFTRDHPQAQKAAEFLLSCQTEDGDIRGMLANQYATYYTGAIMSLLIQAGYDMDPRIEKGFQWLLDMRQADQGWSTPLITHKFDRATMYRLTSQWAEPVEPDRSKPFSHNATGMVLRAFAVHSQYHKSQEAWMAANLLKSRFFLPDAYTSYQAASYWLRFDSPFWWNNLVATLDSISLIGLSKDDQQIQKALIWLRDHQDENGLWRITYAKLPEEIKDTPKGREKQLWVSLAICRVFKRFYG